MGPQDRAERLEPLELQAQPVRPEPQGQLEPPELRVPVEPRARTELRVQQDQLEQQALRERLEPLALQERPEPLGPPEPLVLRAQLEPPARPVPLVRLEQQESPELLALRELPVQPV
jgi:hypothetical protein